MRGWPEIEKDVRAGVDRHGALNRETLREIVITHNPNAVRRIALVEEVGMRLEEAGLVVEYTNAGDVELVRRRL